MPQRKDTMVEAVEIKKESPSSESEYQVIGDKIRKFRTIIPYVLSGQVTTTFPKSV